MIYTKNSYVSGSMCDSSLKLSILAADEIVENSVTELMGDLGIDGIVAKEKYNAMWLLAKNNICFLRRPSWREEFVIKCYISKYSAVRLNIDTTVQSLSGELLVNARTELAAIDLETGRIRKAETVGFREEMAHPAENEGMDFSRFPQTDYADIETVTIRSTSIDYCFHTNNIEYVRFVLNTYDMEFLKTHEPLQIEIHYASQSFEGEKIDISKLSSDSSDYFSIRRNGNEITSFKFAWTEKTS